MKCVVKVFALSTCPWCKKTKQLLSDNHIAFDFVDVDLLEGAEQQKALAEIDQLVSRRAFPITVINGVVIQGFEPEKILKEAGHAV